MTQKAKKIRYFGCHVSAAGGLVNALANAQELEINTVQIHASPPQRWNDKPFPAGIENDYLAQLPKSGLARMFFHGIYLINLAGTNKRNLHLSKLSLIHALDLMHRLGGDGVVFHLGSMKDQPSEREGYCQAAEIINDILESSKNSARLILEVAAGSGAVIGDRMEELQEIYSMLEQKDRVGFGLDSQHMWASGYDLRSNLDGVISDVERCFGLEKVWLIHLNDSKSKLGSRVDRHENVGDGEIGLDALTRLFLHPKLSSIPFVLETPAMKDMASAKVEVGKLRRILEFA